MKRSILMLAACGLMVCVGCEEKKPEAPKPALPSVPAKAADAAKAAGDAVKDAAKAAGDKMSDAAKTAGDAVKAGAEKAKDAAAGAVDKAKDAAGGLADKVKEGLVSEVKAMGEKLKGQLDTLTKGGEALPADKKVGFEAALTPLKDQFKSMSDSVSKLTAGTDTKAISELKDKGTTLLSGIKSVAEKFGIKL